jgi:UDP-N-acetylmuramoyl-L-alanyl-D-glutamate--2,6-diaminopimelate ligase
MIKKLIKKLIPPFLLSWYHFLLSLTGALVYGFPSRKLKVIGVTGTNGKTTVVNLTSGVLEEVGFKVASLSSVRFKIGEEERVNTLKMTMPGRFKIQKFLREAVNKKCQYAVLEVSSEGIRQHRHRFIDFSVALITNLTPEHIESHGGFENYKKAKGELFKVTKKVHIVNVDDKNAEYFLSFKAEKKYTFGWDKGDVNSKDLNFNFPLPGRFNKYNAMAAMCVGLSQGISIEACKKALEKAKGVPGRMEMVVSDPFKVVVDYAVTPDALEGLYQTIKEMYSPSRIIAVFGSCGGGRDKWKRPLFGEIASRYCQEIIVTNEDPYDEDPMEIINQVAAGSKGKAKKILDRREAIREALKSAKPGDVVVITGKGSEPQMITSKGRIPWSDKKVILEEMSK